MPARYGILVSPFKGPMALRHRPFSYTWLCAYRPYPFFAMYNDSRLVIANRSSVLTKNSTI